MLMGYKGKYNGNGRQHTANNCKVRSKYTTATKVLGNRYMLNKGNVHRHTTQKCTIKVK